MAHPTPRVRACRVSKPPALTVWMRLTALGKATHPRHPCLSSSNTNNTAPSDASLLHVIICSRSLHPGHWYYGPRGEATSQRLHTLPHLLPLRMHILPYTTEPGGWIYHFWTFTCRPAKETNKSPKQTSKQSILAATGSQRFSLLFSHGPCSVLPRHISIPYFIITN